MLAENVTIRWPNRLEWSSPVKQLISTCKAIEYTGSNASIPLLHVTLHDVGSGQRDTRDILYQAPVPLSWSPGVT